LAHAHVISCLHTRHYTYENTHTHTIGGDNAVAACASWPAVALRSIEPQGPIRSVASLVAVTRTRQSVRARHLVRAKHQIRHLLRARPKQRHLERYILMPRLSLYHAHTSLTICIQRTLTRPHRTHRTHPGGPTTPGAPLTPLGPCFPGSPCSPRGPN